MIKFIPLLFLLYTALPAQTLRPIETESIYLTEIDYQISVNITDQTPDSGFVHLIKDKKDLRMIPFSIERSKSGSTADFKIRFPESGRYQMRLGDQKIEQDFRVIPGWMSILPPLAAIILALVTRQVLIALFAGIWLGAAFLFDFNIFSGFLQALSGYIGKAPATPERISILIFSLALGGMVGVISRSGGTRGIVEVLARYASNARRGQLATWLMGVLIFFDDYANTLVVGNTMRPLTDRLRISREKLSYLVDSTAAPVANIAIISTWIGYEISLINDSFLQIGLQDNAYITFFKTIPYNFYPLFSLFFGLVIALLGRDLFSMYRAEKRAAETGQTLREGATPLADMDSSELEAKPGAPLRWYNALIPVSVVILTTLLGLWFTGLTVTPDSGLLWEEQGLIHYASTVIGNSDSFSVLIWASFIGGFVAIIMAVWQKILKLEEALTAWVGGIKAMIMAALILTMAWAIGNICADLHTAAYVTATMKGLLSPHLLPAFAFIIAGIIAFSTGTSWGTMAILTPIIIPLAYELPLRDPAIGEMARSGLFLSSIASILAGATFGDHCSPISDTTIMSSMASGADHIDHVRTQLPYAAISAGVSILFGYLLVGFEVPVWASLLAGMVVIYLVVRFGGKKIIQGKNHIR